MDDTAFVALAAEERREILSKLSTTRPDDPPVRVPEDLILGAPDATAMATRLHHVHLPKLASMGYVTWDAESAEVHRGPAFDELSPLLEVLNEHEEQASD